MDTRLEQRANIKFCVKLRKSATETFEMLQQAYGDDAMSRARCFEWHSRFKNGRTSLKDDERSGRLSTSTSPEIVHEVERIVQKDRRTTISELALIWIRAVHPHVQFGHAPRCCEVRAQTSHS